MIICIKCWLSIFNVDSFYSHFRAPYFFYLLVSPCDSEPCTNEGECTNAGDGFECKCPLGYTGKRCETKGNEKTYGCNNTCFGNTNMEVITLWVLVENWIFTIFECL